MSELWEDFVLAEKIIKGKYFIHVIVILCLFLGLFRIKNSSLIDWDEGVFSLQAQWLSSIGAQGKPFNFQTPPLYQTLIAVLFKCFGTNARLIMFLSLFFSLITIYTIFYFIKKLYSERLAVYTTLFFVTTEYFLFFFKSGLSEATFLFFFTTAVLSFLNGCKNRDSRSFLLSGAATTLALYTKYSAFPLLLIFLIIGFRHRKRINGKWFLLTIILPLLLFLPYLYLFIRIVSISGIGSRHATLLGFNHTKFLIYLATFAPVPLLFTLLYIIIRNKKQKKEWDVLICLLVFFAILGFYHPYFRLAYPMVPFLALLSAQLALWIKGAARTAAISAALILSLILSIKTITYKSRIPERIGELVEFHRRKNNLHYIYTIVPPNIDFYINHPILIPTGHNWLEIGGKFPVLLKKKKVIHPDNNELINEKKVLLLHATIFDSFKEKHPELYQRAVLLQTVEFKDAPVYYKDIFNPQKDIKQIYELYLFDVKELGESVAELWNLGFEKKVTVMAAE